MELIIGGAFQGQLEYAKELFPNLIWVDGRTCTWEALKKAQGVWDFQAYIYRAMQEKRLQPDLAAQLYEANPKLILVSNEVGSGVVPVDAFDREYREKVGRICTELAEKSVRVHRVLCGIGTCIKG